MNKKERKQKIDYIFRSSLKYLSYYLNQSVGILNNNSLVKIYEIWKQEDAPIHKLKAYIEIKDLSELKVDYIKYNLAQYFFPAITIHKMDIASEAKEKVKEKDKLILHTIWKYFPFIIHNYYRALKEYFPYIIAVFRLQLFRLIWLNMHEISIDNVIIPIGMGLHIIVKEIILYGKKGILIVGGNYLKENIESWKKKEYHGEEGEKYFKIDLEQYAYSFIDDLEDFLGIKHTIKIDSNKKHYLLSQLYKNIITKRDILVKNICLTRNILNIIQQLIRNCYNKNNIYSLIAVEWRRIIQWLIFIYETDKIYNERNYCTICSSKQSAIFNKLKNHFRWFPILKNKQSSVNKKCKLPNFYFKIMACLSPRKDSVLQIKLKFDINSFVIKWTPEKNNVELLLLPERKFIPIDIELIVPDNIPIKIKTDYINFLNSLIIEIKEKITKQFLFFKEQFYTNENYTDWLFFDRFKYNLQNMPFKEIRRRCIYSAKCALYLVNAIKSSYYEYKGINDCLEENMTTYWDYTFNKTYIEKKIYKEEINVYLKKWAKDSDERAKSAIYRCLDKQIIISRFRTNDNYDTIFAQKIFDYVPNQRTLDSDGCKNGDILAVPIMFHGRRQGVIHLDSQYSCDFTSEDRYRILNFKRLFEEELFEARMINTIFKMHDDLGQVLDNKISEDAFFNRIASSITSLLGANGIIILIKANEYSTDYKIIGIECKDFNIVLYNKLFNVEAESLINKAIIKTTIVVINNPIQSISDGQLKSVLKQLNIKSTISLPLFNEAVVLGVVLILDNYVNTDLSIPLKNELKYLGQEIEQIFKHYYDHKKQIQNFQTIYGHDLDSFMRSIQGNCNELTKLVVDLGEEDEFLEKIKKKINDIKQYTIATHSLFQVLINARDFDYKDLNRANLLRYYGDSSESKKYQGKYTDIYDILKIVLHSHGRALNQKRIEFNLQPNSLVVAIPEIIINRIFNNLVDNVVKYGIPWKIFNIWIETDIFEDMVFFENYAKPLKKEYRNNPTMIFNKGIQGHFSANKKEGQGMGLYIAKQLAASFGGGIKLEYEYHGKLCLYRFILTIPPWHNKDFKN